MTTSRGVGGVTTQCLRTTAVQKMGPAKGRLWRAHGRPEGVPRASPEDSHRPAGAPGATTGKVRGGGLHFCQFWGSSALSVYICIYMAISQLFLYSILGLLELEISSNYY